MYFPGERLSSIKLPFKSAETPFSRNESPGLNRTTLEAINGDLSLTSNRVPFMTKPCEKDFIEREKRPPAEAEIPKK